MPLWESKIKQLFEKDRCSNYYSYAFDTSKSRYLPLKLEFLWYINLYKTFLSKGSYRCYFPEASQVHPFDLLAKDGGNICSRLSVNNQLMESSQVYIQLLFPTKTPYQYEPSVLLSDYDITMIRSTPSLQKTALFHFAMIMSFFNFYLEVTQHDKNPAEDVVLIKQVDSDQPSWLNKSYNYGRSVRIIEFLNLVGLRNYMAALKLVLHQLFEKYTLVIGERVKDIWNLTGSQSVEIAVPELSTEELALQNDYIKILWHDAVRDVQAYFKTLDQPSWSDGLFKVRRESKYTAVLVLMKALTGKIGLVQKDILVFKPDRIVGIENSELKSRLLYAGEIARGFISADSDVTAGWQSHLNELLEKIISIERACVSIDALKAFISEKNKESVLLVSS